MDHVPCLAEFKTMPPSPASNTCLAFLVRHGATENNLADPPLLQGRAVDFGLSAAGFRQADQAADLLAQLNVAAIYSSPLRRARETADRIAKRHDCKLELVNELQEVDVGRWESRSWAEIAETEPEDHRRFLEDASVFGYPEGENMNQVLARVLPTIERLMREHLGQRIVIIGHNVVNRVFLAHVLGVPLAKARRVSHNNCGVSVVRYRDEDQNLRLLTLNATFHLETADLT
jgi:broad specificity phosphatase PhoE